MREILADEEQYGYAGAGRSHVKTGMAGV